MPIEISLELRKTEDVTSNFFPHGNNEEEILDEAQHIPQDT
ncbi:hypothetical protein [Bartonella quintana]|nr:hypothetical protein [Bartonella quintana]